MQSTSIQWERMRLFTTQVNPAWGFNNTYLLTKPSSLQNMLFQKYIKLKRWPQTSDTKFKSHISALPFSVAFCSALPNSSPEKTSPSKLSSAKWAKPFLLFIIASACLKTPHTQRAFFSYKTFLRMCCLTVTHLSSSVLSPTCTVR